MMASAYFGVKGCLYSFNGLVLLPFLRSMGVTGRDYQVLGAASRAPFAMKALFGAVSVNPCPSRHIYLRVIECPQYNCTALISVIGDAGFSTTFWIPQGVVYCFEREFVSIQHRDFRIIYHLA